MFRPEFLNRLRCKYIVFRALNETEINTLVDVMLRRDVAKRLKDFNTAKSSSMKP